MTEKHRLSPGSYYLFAPKHGALPTFFSFGRGDKSAQERCQALVKSADKALQQGGGGGAGHSLQGSTFNPSPSTYSLGGGAAAVVQPGLFDVAGELLRVQPNVAYDAGRSIICIFSGYLSNLDELLERYPPDAGPDSPRGSPTGVLAAARGAGAGADQRQLAAELVQRAYVRQRSGDLLVLLSELQGQYAFSVYDGEKHCAFAARDSSGREPLFYEINSDNAVSLSNAQLAVPADAGFVQWAELPPGHFISGRTPKLGQFALTPEQLSIREYFETLTDEFEGASPRAAAYYGGAGAGAGDGMRSTSSELEVFPPSIHNY